MKKDIAVLSLRIRVAACAVVTGFGLVAAGVAHSAGAVASPAERTALADGDVGWNVAKPSVAA